jgi:hypothetical protein
MIRTTQRNLPQPPPVLEKMVMPVNKFSKQSGTKSIGTQTDPVHVSLKSRRAMGFKIHPTDYHREKSPPTRDYPEGVDWIDDYWTTR